MGPDLLTRLRERAAQSPKRIVYPESGDPRVQQAARRVADAGIAKPVFIDPTAAKRAKYAQMLLPEWRSKGITEAEAQTRLENPMYFAAAMVRAGDADGM